MFRASFESSPATALASLRESGCALLSANGLRALVHAAPAELDTLRDSWNRLPRDEHLRDGGHYRYRRHSCFVIARDDDHLVPVPHRAHYQPLDYNALHGGIERWFQPIEGSVIASPAWGKLVGGLGRAFFALSAAPRWYVEAHPFRIDTAEGIGRPTPEGAHRDGVDYVAVVLIDRVAVKGGETRVFESEGAHGIRFTMREPWSALLLDDARVIHETSPVQPAGDAAAAHRDTLVLTFRAGGFQAP